MIVGGVKESLSSVDQLKVDQPRLYASKGASRSLDEYLLGKPSLIPQSASS